MLGKRHQNADQKLEGNNLYLKNAMTHGAPVRMFRKCGNCTGPTYMKSDKFGFVYCGLYKVGGLCSC
jgi:hypothetical protein